MKRSKQRTHALPETLLFLTSFTIVWVLGYGGDAVFAQCTESNSTTSCVLLNGATVVRNHDFTITLPDESENLYDIKLIVDIGPHSDTDRLGSFYVKDGSGTSYELARFVTSYSPSTSWKVDVSEMRPLLLGPTELSLSISSSNPWTISARLDFSVGDTTKAHPITVIPLGSFSTSYRESSSFKDHVFLDARGYEINGPRVDLRAFISGHGSYEFKMYKHLFRLSYGSQQSAFDGFIWRSDCNRFINCTDGDNSIDNCVLDSGDGRCFDFDQCGLVGDTCHEDHKDDCSDSQCSDPILCALRDPQTYCSGTPINSLCDANPTINPFGCDRQIGGSKSREGWCPGEPVDPIHVTLDLGTSEGMPLDGSGFVAEYRLYSERGNDQFIPECSPHEVCYNEHDKCAECQDADDITGGYTGCYVPYENHFNWTQYPVTEMLVVYGEDPVIDDRDGTPYQVVKIGNQRWFAENLNRPSDGRCYGDNSVNCDKYGSLHTWGQASKPRWSGGENLPTICPRGSRLPSKTDWNELISFIADNTVLGNGTVSNALREFCPEGDCLCSWRNHECGGDDELGFNALSGGFYNVPLDKFTSRTRSALFWTRTQVGASKAYRVYMNNEDIHGVAAVDKQYGLSVRCIVGQTADDY